jgi:hypothetical protein
MKGIGSHQDSRPLNPVMPSIGRRKQRDEGVIIQMDGMGMGERPIVEIFKEIAPKIPILTTKNIYSIITSRQGS